jgi:hypothetical protein
MSTTRRPHAGNIAGSVAPINPPTWFRERFHVQGGRIYLRGHDDPVGEEATAWPVRRRSVRDLYGNERAVIAIDVYRPTTGEHTIEHLDMGLLHETSLPDGWDVFDGSWRFYDMMSGLGVELIDYPMCTEGYADEPESYVIRHLAAEFWSAKLGVCGFSAHRSLTNKAA